MTRLLPLALSATAVAAGLTALARGESVVLALTGTAPMGSKKVVSAVGGAQSATADPDRSNDTAAATAQVRR